MDKQTRFWLTILTSILVLIVLTYFLNIGLIWSIISKMNLFYFALTLMAYCLVNFCMSKRIKLLLEEMGSKISLKDSLKANFAGMLASDFTPARSGYFLSAFIISAEQKIELDKTMVSIFAPQLIEFAIKVACTAILALFILSRMYNAGNWGLYVSVSLLIASATIAFFWALLFVKGLLEKFSVAKKFPLLRKLYYLFALMRDNSGVILKRWKSVLFYSVSAWFSKGIEWFLLSHALNIVIFADPLTDFVFFLLFNSFLTLTNFIPLPTLAGTGASEAASAAVFALLGAGVENGVAFAFMARVLMIAVDTLGLLAIVPLFMKENFETILSDIENIEKRSKDT